MTEDPGRQIRRRDLERERRKLAQAQVWLSALHKTKDEDEEMCSTSEEILDEPMDDWNGTFA